MAGIPQIKIIFDRRKKASVVTAGTVEVEVSYNRERVRLSTGVAVLKQQWRSNQVVDHPMADSLNEQIRRVADGIREKMASIVAHGGEYDLSLLKKVRKTRVQSSAIDFLTWLEERIDMRPVSESTHRQHKVMLFGSKRQVWSQRARTEYPIFIGTKKNCGRLPSSPPTESVSGT